MTNLLAIIDRAYQTYPDNADAAAAQVLLESAGPGSELLQACAVCFAAVSLWDHQGPELLRYALNWNGSSEAAWERIRETGLMAADGERWLTRTGARRVFRDVLRKNPERYEQVHGWLGDASEQDLAVAWEEAGPRSLGYRDADIRHAYHLTPRDGEKGGDEYRRVYVQGVKEGFLSDQRRVESLALEQRDELLTHEADLAFYQGHAAYISGNRPEARKAFLRVVQGPPTILLVIAAHLLGRMADGLTEAEHWYALSLSAAKQEDDLTLRSRSRCIVLVSWGNTLFTFRRYGEADGKFSEATEADPRNAPAWQAWALLEKEQGKIETARKYFQRATEADPRHAPAWQAWAVMEKEQGEIATARKYFQRATEADPRDAPAWQAWAVMEKEQGRLQEAVQLLRRSAEVEPDPEDRAWTYCNIARIQKRLRDFAGAEASYLEALRHHPESSFAQRELEDVRKRMG